MRLFIAIPFEPPVLDAMAAVQTSFKSSGVRGNYTVRENLHLTLAFLGEVRDPRPVIGVLERVPLPESIIKIEKPELFRDILVSSFHVSSSLREYVRNLRKALDASGIDYDRKPFRPHVTLVRRASFPGQIPDVPLFPDEIPVHYVCLMRTDFIDRRPKYTSLYTKTAQSD